MGDRELELPDISDNISARSGNRSTRSIGKS